ncbi:MAG: DUF2232 domain-containing protein [Alphaproteobacteria bacterium]|nr:DUF2232 domain-containing protein [Alphaproteobacteria bacterium]
MFIGSPFVLCVYLAAVPVFVMPLLMAGLGAGRGAAIVAAAVGAGLTFGFSAPVYGVFYVLMEAIPALALSVIALRPVKPGAMNFESNVVAFLIAWPLFLFFIICTVMPGHLVELRATIVDAFVKVNREMLQALAQSGKQVTPEMIDNLHGAFQFFATFFPAMVMAAWLISSLMALVVAQFIVQQQKWNLRPTFSIVKLRVSNWTIYTSAVGAAAVFAPAPYDYPALNAIVILCVPFLLVGLAVVHAYVATMRYRIFILAFFYLIFFASTWIAMLMVLLGVVDQRVDFRKRFAERNLTKGDKL